MRQTNGTRRSSFEKVVKDIKRATRKQYFSKEKISDSVGRYSGEDSNVDLCCHEAHDLKGVVAEKTLELCLLKKAWSGMGNEVLRI